MSYQNSKYFILCFSFISLFVLSCVKKNTSTNVIEVCPHYNCADATVIQLTDQYYPPKHFTVRNDSRKFSAAWAEFLAFKYNIPLHVFEHNIKGKEFTEFLSTGRGGASIYYPSCHYEYRKSKLDSIKVEIEKVYGKSISTLAYGCGSSYYADSLPRYILAARNSGYTSIRSKDNGAISWYGFELGYRGYADFSNKMGLLKHASGGRFYGDLLIHGVSLNELAQYTTREVKKTAKNGGFYTNFMHWHDYSKNRNDSLIEGVTVMESLFKAMNEGLKNAKNSGLDYNEAIEYLYTKELVGKVEIVKDEKNEFQLRIKHTLKKDINYSLLDTPLSIKIPQNLVSKFAFVDIDAVENVIDYRKHSNHVILNILLDSKANETSIVLTKSKKTNKIHTVLERPSVLVKSWFTNEMRFSKKSKLVLFRRKKEAKDYEIEVADRTTAFSEKYKLPEFEEGYDYFCGLINENRQSTLIELE